jgi:hypothetical protein
MTYMQISAPCLIIIHQNTWGLSLGIYIFNQFRSSSLYSLTGHLFIKAKGEQSPPCAHWC